MRILPFVPTAVVFLICCADLSPGPEVYASVQTIEAGCSGGFAGFITTVSVNRDGQVDYVLRPSDPRQRPDAVSKETVDHWLAALEAARFLEQDSSEKEYVPDGIHCGISLKGPQLIHSLDASADLDPEIRRVFEEIVGLAEGQ